MDPIVINLSPKIRFMANAAAVKAHRAMAQSEAFEAAIQAALLEYQNILCNAKDANMAAAAHFKSTGALEFANLFKTLAESPRAAAKTQDRDNLQHR